MALGKEGLGLAALGIILLIGSFILGFNGLITPLNALATMTAYLVWGIVIGFSLLFVVIGLLMAFN